MFYKILIYTRCLFLAFVLFALDMINWRDFLLILCLPITLYHLLSMFMYYSSKPTKNANKN